MIHPELDENFLAESSKVDEVITFLADFQKSNKTDATKEKDAKLVKDDRADLTPDNFLVAARCKQVTKKYNRTAKKVLPVNMNHMSFMCQIEPSPMQRSQARLERIRVATNYRRFGNLEYCRTNYDKAIELFTKGLEYISDSPVLFVNRSLCFIKKREYKRAIIDLEYVINNLDTNCLRAWLYKAGALKRMNNEAGYEECIASARRLNRQEEKYIDHFIDRMRSDF